MQGSKADFVFKNAIIITMNQKKDIFYRADIAVKDDKIIAIGADLNIKTSRNIEASNCAILPGLINAHMHETLTRGACEDLPLDRWLNEICFHLDRSYTYEIMEASALMNQAEMIRGGITTFLDIYRFPDACAKVVEQSGLRSIIAPQIIDQPSGVGETLESAKAFIDRWKNKNTRITPAFGPHAPYSCYPRTYEEISNLSAIYDSPVHTHIAETQWEVDRIQNRYNCTPVEYLLRTGFFNRKPVSLAHAIYLTKNDIEIIRELDLSIIYNPTSNMKLASGVAPIVEMIEKDICVALGTDSNLSNNNLDMWEEMRIGAILQKLYSKDASVLSCGTMLEMATINGAKALGMDELIGSLEIGKQADMVVLDMDKPHLWPHRQGGKSKVIEHLVYSANASDVLYTVVAGKILMDERKLNTLDLSCIRSQVKIATEILYKRAGFL